MVWASRHVVRPRRTSLGAIIGAPARVNAVAAEDLLQIPGNVRRLGQARFFSRLHSLWPGATPPPLSTRRWEPTEERVTAFSDSASPLSSRNMPYTVIPEFVVFLRASFGAGAAMPEVAAGVSPAERPARTQAATWVAGGARPMTLCRADHAVNPMLSRHTGRRAPAMARIRHCRARTSVFACIENGQTVL